MDLENTLESRSPLKVFSSSSPLESLQHRNAFLGISLSKNKYFSKWRVAEYLRWAESRHERTMVIVADQLEAHNVAVFRGVSLNEAVLRVRVKGEELQRGYVRAVPPTMRQRCEVVLASDLLARPECRALCDLVDQAAAENALFRNDIRAVVHENLLSHSNGDAGSRRTLVEANIAALGRYIIEEIAIVLYLNHRASPRYTVALFPYSPFAALTHVYNGAYGDLFAAVTGGDRLEFVELAPSDEAGEKQEVVRPIMEEADESAERS